MALEKGWGDWDTHPSTVLLPESSPSLLPLRLVCFSFVLSVGPESPPNLAAQTKDKHCYPVGQEFRQRLVTGAACVWLRWLAYGAWGSENAGERWGPQLSRSHVTTAASLLFYRPREEEILLPGQCPPQLWLQPVCLQYVYADILESWCSLFTQHPFQANSLMLSLPWYGKTISFLWYLFPSPSSSLCSYLHEGKWKYRLKI